MYMCVCIHRKFSGKGWLFVILLNQNKTQGMDYFTFLDLDWFLTEPFPSPPYMQPGSLFCILCWKQISIVFLVMILHLLKRCWNHFGGENKTTLYIKRAAYSHTRKIFPLIETNQLFVFLPNIKTQTKKGKTETWELFGFQTLSPFPFPWNLTNRIANGWCIWLCDLHQERITCMLKLTL